MKKVLFILAAILLAITHLNAQTTLMATLSHGDSISTYYGAGALVSAYNASEAGDVITLSSGQFNATNITKNIIIRGAGYDSDAVTGRQPTIILGDFTIGGEVETTIEGIFHNSMIYYGGSNAKISFIKCRLNKIEENYSSSKDYNNFTLLNCYVVGSMRLNGTSWGNSYNSAVCINCVMYHPWCHDRINVFEFRNCYLFYSKDLWQSNNFRIINSNFTNCFINTDIEGFQLPASNIASYCVGFSPETFSLLPNSNNTVIDNTNIFESFSATCQDGATYKLTNEAKTQYIGSDGKEIGIYGGMLPFSPIPSNPQITKFNVAEKSTADGKLSIDITVEMPE